MKIKKIVVIGDGILGSQIAFQAAYCGYEVSLCLSSPSEIESCQARLDTIADTYQKDLLRMATPEGKAESTWSLGLADPDKFDLDICQLKVAAAHHNVKMVTDLKDTVREADVVIESSVEKKEEKKALYQELAPLLPVKTFVLTTSSTLLPSQFANAITHKENLCSFHFTSPVHRINIVEVMKQKHTSEETFSVACQLAEGMRMIVFKLAKERKGQLLNSMLVPFLFAAFDMAASGTSSIEEINSCWKIATKAPYGPFEIADELGLENCYQMVSFYEKSSFLFSPYHYKDIRLWLKNTYLDQGKTGKDVGHGFFDYD